MDNSKDLLLQEIIFFKSIISQQLLTINILKNKVDILEFELDTFLDAKKKYEKFMSEFLNNKGLTIADIEEYKVEKEIDDNLKKKRNKKDKDI